MTESPMVAARRVDALEAAENTDDFLGALAINTTLAAMRAIYDRTSMLPGDFRTHRSVLKLLVNLPPAKVDAPQANGTPTSSSVPSRILDDVEKAMKDEADKLSERRVA